MTNTTTSRGASTTDLIDLIANQQEVTKASVKEKVGHIVDGIVSLTKEHGALQINGLGGFKTVARDAREGRNPRTGATIQIPASTGVKFTAAKSFKDSVNA
jgi:DNA-binding protein HU-beta